MARMVQCKKLGKELPGVVYKPFDNELGQRIYDNISQDAWKMGVEHSKMLVAMGDCAVAGNVPSMRNPFGVSAVCDRAYRENVNLAPGIPDQVVPKLLDRVRPIHEVVPVDVFVPGCPPSASVIHYVLMELIEGRRPELSTRTRFGA